MANGTFEVEKLLKLSSIKTEEHKNLDPTNLDLPNPEIIQN